jgi:hypothetical protein
MGRYLLFSGEHYYPLGGWEDFIESSDDLNGLIARSPPEKVSWGWWHIVDTQTSSIVASHAERESQDAPKVE